MVTQRLPSILQNTPAFEHVLLGESKMVQEEATLEAIVSMTEVLPDMKMQIVQCAMERADLFTYHPKGEEPENLEQIRQRHALLIEYKKGYDHDLRRYKELMVMAIVNALEAKRKEDPERYNGLAERIAALVRTTGDKLILPIYSRRRTEVTRNSSNGGGIYDVQVILPNGETLDLIAKKFEKKEDFQTDVFSEERLGDGLLAIDEREHVKVELNKGNTTLTEKMVSSESYEKVTVLYEVAKRVIKELKKSERSKDQFLEPRDRPQHIYDCLVDAFSHKRHDLGKRYVVKQVDNFTQDFIERWAYRLAPEMKPENHDKKRKMHPAVKRLYRVLQQDFEPILQRQKRHVINWDLNGGNVLFDQSGNIETCDRELTRVDLVQKCAYDLTEKQNLTTEQELSIADLFYLNLDLGVDHTTFREIYFKRKVLEDLAFTKYLEYADDGMRADTPAKKQMFEDGALYYFNRAMRLADKVGSDDFHSAVEDIVKAMGKERQLYRVDDETFEDLERKVIGCETLNLTQDPIERLKMLFSTEYNSVENRRDILYRRPGESKITKRLSIGAATGLALAILIGGLKVATLVENTVSPETNPVRTVEFMNMSNVEETGRELTLANIELINRIVPNYTRFEIRNAFAGEYQRLPEDFAVDFNIGHNQFGTPKRLHKAIFYAITVTSADPDEGQLGPLLVPESYFSRHFADNGLYRSEESVQLLREDVEEGRGPSWAASSRYARQCLLSNDGNIVDTIAQYYLGREDMQRAMIASGSQNYFDEIVDDMNDSTAASYGYRNQIPEHTRDLIDTTLYFYLHMGRDTAEYYPDRIFTF